MEDFGMLVLLAGQLLLHVMQSSLTLLLAYRRLRARRMRAYFLLCRASRARLALADKSLGTSRRRLLRSRWYSVARTESCRKCWVYPRTQHWWESTVLECWDDKEWVRCFRMGKNTFFDLVRLLRPHLQRQVTVMRSPVPVEKKVAITVWVLATGATYRQASDQFGVGLSTVGEAVLEVCLAIEIHLLRKTVRLGPEVGKIIDGFSALGFPNCVGAMDGCHIPICAPRGSPDEYGNRKKILSMLIQGTADSTGRFINVELGWSGKNHDAFVFRNSALCAAMDAGTFVPDNPTMTLDGVKVPPLIIADGAYPMRAWLIKPYGRHARTEQERAFDYALLKARNVVECAFGRLKARWRILATRMNARERNLVSMMAACVVLHNLCEEKGHQVLSEMPKPAPSCVPQEEIPPTGREQRMREEGRAVRDALCAFLTR